MVTPFDPITVRRGFSLIEIVVVVMIIGILAALVAPRYASSINQYHVSAAARKVASDLYYAQARARAASATRTVSFSVNSSSTLNTYQVLAEPDPVVPGNIYTVNLSATPYAASVTSVNFNGAATVSFNGYGIPSSGGSIALQSGGIKSIVTLDGVSGMVSIQ